MFSSACLMVVSMVLSPFLLSISMWGMAAAAWWHVMDTVRAESTSVVRRSGAVWALAVVRSFKNLWKNRELSVLTLLLLAPAVSIFWSEDWGYWLRVTRVRLPFLVLPWVFVNVPRLRQSDYQRVLYLLVWFMVVACVCVGANFLLHYDAVMEGLGRGQPIPVPRQHVRFSLVLATAIVAGVWLWRRRFRLKYRWEQPALAAAVVFLFLFIHVLSVRGGLAVLYMALVVSVVWYGWHTRRWATGLLILGALVALLWGGINVIPSLQQRVAYMRYDWARYKANDGALYSDAARWTSLKVGYRIWKENPILGTGAGDLLSEVKRVAAADYPDYAKDPKLPHNQWIHTMASTGLLGLLLSMLAFLTPFFAHKYRANYLFTAFQAMAFVTFIIECTIENAIGVSWYLFYTLWFAAMAEQDG